MKPGREQNPDRTALRVVAWETTRRCALNCRHCRGSARDRDYEGELSGDEARAMIRGLAAFARPLLILTGGEPMIRGDIYELARYAVDRGLRVAMSPCGPMITPEAAAMIRDSGVGVISVSLDGASAATHDEFRGAPGAFEAALRGLNHARDAGVQFQINSTVTRRNLAELPAILELALELGAAAFSPFLLVPTGRGSELRDIELSAAEYERTLVWVHEQSLGRDISIRPTCAPHYYRIAHSRPGPKPQGGRGPAPTRGCLGGQGFAFVSHRGILQICGFLDLPCGDLRAAGFDFETLYNTSEIFLAVRDRANYGGKCGVCEHWDRCGGCRARAWAATGDYLGEEPLCAYIPAELRTT